jgi:hypothetical protein
MLWEKETHPSVKCHARKPFTFHVWFVVKKKFRVPYG